MNPPVEIWDRRYAGALHTSGALRDAPSGAWFERWLENVPGSDSGPSASPSPLRALDLGCGAGHDTACLLARGYDVTAIDHSANALELSRRRNPGARHLRADLRDLDSVLPLPAGPGAGWHLVSASLSLHYFTRGETLKIFAAIHARLRPGGLLAFRVNAFDDYGAPPDPTSWELTVVDGVAKQFFTEDKIRAALAGRFGILSLRKLTVVRHGSEKSLYEAIVLKPDAAAS